MKTLANTLYAEWGNRRIIVASIEDAAAKWCAFRDTTNAGVSEIGNGVDVITATGECVAHVSYNGKIWPPDPSKLKRFQP
jgi:hypothetical protein